MRAILSITSVFCLCGFAAAAQIAAGQPASQATTPRECYATFPMTARQAKAVQRASAERLGIPVEFTNSVGMKMVYVPPGWYLMGAGPFEEDADLAEGPQQLVVMPNGFYMSHWEVTREQYDTFWFSPESLEANRRARYYLRPAPMEIVTEDQANRFLKALSQKEARTYRLPTEPEWEYACRAGTVTPYAFGEKLPLAYVRRPPAPELAELHVSPTFPKDEIPPWWPANWRDWTWAYRTEQFRSVESRPFDEFPPEASNAWGLYHMHGSLWEWCQFPRLANPPRHAQPGDDLRENSRYGGGNQARDLKDRAATPQRYAEARLRGGEMYCPAEACRSAARISEHYPSAGVFSSKVTGKLITMGPGTYRESDVVSSGWSVPNGGCRAVCDVPLEAQRNVEATQLADALIPKAESLQPELRQWAEPLSPEDLYRAAVSLLAAADDADDAVEKREKLGQTDQAEKKRAERAELEQKIEAVRCYMVLRVRVPWDSSVAEKALPPDILAWSKALAVDELRKTEEMLVRQIRSADSVIQAFQASGQQDKADLKRTEKEALELKLRAVRLRLSAAEKALPPDILAWSKALPPGELRKTEEVLVRQMRSEDGEIKALQASGQQDKADLKRKEKEKEKLELKLQAVRLRPSS